MSRVMNLLLVPPVHQAVQTRYRTYRRHGSSAFTAFFTTLLVALGWIFLRFESPVWQRLRAARSYWFPHLSSSRPRPADALRYLVQGLWLLVFRTDRAPVTHHRFAGWRRLQLRYAQWLQTLPQRLENAGLEQRSVERLGRMSQRMRRLLFIIVGVLAAILAILCISQPFDLPAQFVFVVLLWAIAMVVRRVPGRLPGLMLIVLSLTVSCRYLWWRYTATLNWDDPLSLTCGLLLLIAETYAWVVLVLGYFQTVWPLNRQPVPMPADSATWPTIDLLVPTYNEDLGVVKPTIYAALGIDWPKEKVSIYILDDGNRPEFKAFAEEVGVKYIARPTHEHAKAGNINNALKQATGEFVAIFDCDHVPTRSFLQLTMGWFFKDKKLAMLQTPHHFFSPDPLSATWGVFVRRRTKERCSMAWCRTATTCGTRPSSAAPAPFCVAVRWMKSAVSRWKPSPKMPIPPCVCIAVDTPRRISVSPRPPGWRPRACRRTLASVFAGHAAWCKSSGWITRC